MTASLVTDSTTPATRGPAPLEETPLQELEGVGYDVSYELTLYDGHRLERLRHDERERRAQEVLLAALNRGDLPLARRAAAVVIDADRWEDQAALDGDGCAYRAHWSSRLLAGACERAEKWLRTLTPDTARGAL